jgi:hypothetical protein
MCSLAPEVHGFLENGCQPLLLLMQPIQVRRPSPRLLGLVLYGGVTNLVVGVASEDENIDDGELVDEAVALKLLPYAGADRGNWLGDGVHRLDLGGLVASWCQLGYGFGATPCQLQAPMSSGKGIPHAARFGTSPAPAASHQPH